MQRLGTSHFNHPKCLGTLERKDYRDEQGANLPGVEKDLFEWLASAYLCLSQARRITGACSWDTLKPPNVFLGLQMACFRNLKFPETSLRAKEIHGVAALRPETDSENEATISIC
ncbi:hypothetical protein D5086_009465 [Populus alba]|uniref:Uncharacterized protein n=1 Tax=Populus alba TaxID=43335 RepID=A0ACC4CKQ5_POPAL